MSSFSEYTPEQLLFLYQQQFGGIMQNSVETLPEQSIEQSELEALDDLREEAEEESAFTSFMSKKGVFGKDLKAEVAEHMASWRQMRADQKEYEKKLLSGPTALTRTSAEFKFLTRRFIEGQRLVDVEGLVKDSPDYNEALAEWELANDDPERASNFSSFSAADSASTGLQISSSNLSLSAPSFVPFSSSSSSSSLPDYSSYSSSSYQDGGLYNYNDSLPGGGGGGGGDGSSFLPSGGLPPWNDQQQQNQHYYQQYQHPMTSSSSSSSVYGSNDPSMSASSTYYSNASNAPPYHGGHAPWMAGNSQQYASGPTYPYHYSPPPPPPPSSSSSGGGGDAYAMAALLRGLEEADRRGNGGNGH
jgi:hypothetical protein